MAEKKNNTTGCKMQLFVTISFCADTDADFIFQFNFTHFEFYLFILQFNDNKGFFFPSYRPKNSESKKIGTQMTTFPSRFFSPSAHYFPCKYNDCLLFGGLIASEKKAHVVSLSRLQTKAKWHNRRLHS